MIPPFLAYVECIEIREEPKKAPSANRGGRNMVLRESDYISLIAACAAARRAIGTRNGEQDT